MSKLTFMEWNIRPHTKEEKDECLTVEGMRKRINKYQHYDALTSGVFNASFHRGLSGEDTMTVLAFEALCRLEHMTAIYLRQAELSPQPIIWPDDSPASRT